jgi:DNA-binding NarL/FixJ family response regulator
MNDFGLSSSRGKARVFIVHNYAIVRFGMAHLINQQCDLVTCGEASLDAGTAAVIGLIKPDLVVVDLWLTNQGSFELIQKVKQQFPRLPVLVVSAHREPFYAQMALRAGATGYWTHEEELDQLLLALRKVLSGGIYLNEAISSRMLQTQFQRSPSQSQDFLARLSKRELEVLHLLGNWKTTRTIAGELKLSIKTVEFYREQLKKKLNLKNGTELVQFATEFTHSPMSQSQTAPARPVATG